MKKANIIVCVFFLAVLAVLTVASMVNPVREYSESENRNLAQMPEFSLDAVFNGSFTKEYEEFVVDQFVWRDGWIQMKSGIERALGKTLSNGVYFADDGYYIEHKSATDIDAELLEKNIGFLEGFVDGMSQTIKGNTVVSVAPTAAVVHKDKLPRLNDEFDWDGMLDDMAERLGENFSDLREIMSEHKDEYIYYRTDHHWTTDGAYFAYTELIKKFGFEPLSAHEFDRVILSDDFYGTVIAKVNVPTDADTMVKYEPKKDLELKVNYNLGTKVTDTFYAEEKLETRDKYAYFLGGNDALVEIETGVDSGRTLMLAKDSYANCMIPFLACHFEKIYIVDLRYFNLGLVEYTKTLDDVTDALVLYNASGFAADRYLFKLAR
ncbi:MAG: hypothetical protein IJ391_04175 [Clostridia bacterium]|nr:hypothetical protein [Clostridia bacterium]